MAALGVHDWSQAQGALAAARLAGRIVADETEAAPVRGAVVVMTDEIGRSRWTVTDDEGAFRFDELPPGRYVVSASKPPFVAMAHGAARPDRPGVALAVSPGQSISDMLIRLPRGAVVTGTLRDQSGEPLPDVAVTAIRVDQFGGRSASTVSSSARATDDRGVYRIYGLPPGKY